jgi:hypothetical protein
MSLENSLRSMVLNALVKSRLVRWVIVRPAES